MVTNSLLTDAEQRTYDAHKTDGLSFAEIARRNGVNESTIRRRFHRAEQKLETDVDPAVKEAMGAFDLKTVPSQIWFKNKEFSVQMRPDVGEEESFQDRLAKLFENLPAAMPIQPPQSTNDELMAVYPLFDVHLGLRAHEVISGANWDLDIAKREILASMSEVIGKTPAARRAVIINGGDFTHQTDDTNMTRRSGNILDVSARNSVTVEAALKVICTLIEMALSKHELIEYYSVPGNHDPQNWETIQFALRERYRDNPRVRIDVRWDEFSVVEHGEVALFIHHGDKRTPKDMAMSVAAKFADVWGRTSYRMLLTGHLHHISQDEFPGIIWQQLSSPAARDHHASSNGYISYRILNSFVFDKRSKRFGFDALI